PQRRPQVQEPERLRSRGDRQAGARAEEAPRAPLGAHRAEEPARKRARLSQEAAEPARRRDHPRQADGGAGHRKQGHQVGTGELMADTTTETSGAGAKATEVSLLDDILSETKLKPSDDAYDVAKRGVTAFITELLAPGRAIERVDKSLVDAMIAELDARMSAQVNEILHQPE